jgi:hypothetical protein
VYIEEIPDLQQMHKDHEENAKKRDQKKYDKVKTEQEDGDVLSEDDSDNDLGYESKYGRTDIKQILIEHNQIKY